MEFNDIVFSGEDEVKRLKLNTNNKGFNKFFDDFINEMIKLEFYAIKFFSERDSTYEAFFSNIGGIGILALPRKFLESKELSSKDLSKILHEIGHFTHLMMSNGEFMTPRLYENRAVCLEDYRNLQDKFNIEYETYYRSLYYNSIYDMDLRESIVEVNKLNLLNVLVANGLTTRYYAPDEIDKILPNIVPNDIIYTGERINLDNKLTNSEVKNA
jgi:hypothetical protein